MIVPILFFLMLSSLNASIPTNGTPLLINSNSVASVGWIGGEFGSNSNLGLANLSPQSNDWSANDSFYANPNNSQFPSTPMIFEDANGNQHAGFGLLNTTGESMVLNISKYLEKENIWSDPITQEIDGIPATLAIAADELGNIAVLMGLTPDNAPPFTITLAQILADSFTWSDQIILGEDLNSNPVVAATARQGMAILAWKLDTPSLQVQTSCLDFLNQEILPLSNLPLPPATTDVVGMNIAVDSLGDAIIIYGAQIGSNALLYTSTMLAGENSTWSAPQLISNPNNNVLTGSIASDALGTTTILWAEQASSTQQFALAATLPLGGTPTYVTNLTGESTENTTVDASSTVVMDSFGNAAAIWEETTGDSQLIKTASKPKGGNWTEPITLSLSGTTPLITLSDQGTSVATWVDNESKVLLGSRDAALFPLASPSDFVGKLNYVGDKIAMSWNPSLAPNISYYEIYKNKRLIATIPGSGPFRYLQTTSKLDTRNYKIRAVASNGNKSPFVPITILKKCWQW